MVQKSSSKSATLVHAFAASVLLAACGGSQAPAESPEASPAPQGAHDSDAPNDGEHIMPDGTRMKGDEHGEHTMPDGTKMEGHEHGSSESQPPAADK
jgi:hypothetical protein